MIGPSENSTPLRHARPFRARAGFTLVEMLVVALIIAILATAVLFALMNVIDEGKKARTRSQIERLNQLIMTRWEGYQTRQPQGPYLASVNYNDTVGASRARLAALHELMRFELPDRISDLDDANVPVYIELPAITQAYRAQRDLIATETGKTWTSQHQGAECLYLIISQIKDNGRPGLSFFRQAEIGDADNDGMPEIQDAWGVPITFVRWPAGFRSPIQTGNPTEQPDPFDPLQVRQIDAAVTFQLTPLIASAGPDETFNILGDVANAGTSTVDYNGTSPRNDPFASFPEGGNPRYLAEILDDTAPGHLDNITNHLQDL